MQKTKRICIAYAKIKKNMHFQNINHHATPMQNLHQNAKDKKTALFMKNLKQFALPRHKLKRICIAYAKIRNNCFPNSPKHFFRATDILKKFLRAAE